MIVVLKDGLMTDAARNQAATAVAQIADGQVGKLKELGAQKRKAKRALSKLKAAMDARDQAIDDSMALGNSMSGQGMTPSNRRRMRIAQKQITRTEQRFNDLELQAVEALMELQKLAASLQPAVQELHTALQTYGFSLQAPAPLPTRAAR